jgi:hypothetical protein
MLILLAGVIFVVAGDGASAWLDANPMQIEMRLCSLSVRPSTDGQYLSSEKMSDPPTSPVPHLSHSPTPTPLPSAIDGVLGILEQSKVNNYIMHDHGRAEDR